MSHDFEAIYRLYFTPVYRFVLGLSKSPDLADEITAQTFFKALQSLDSFRGDGSIEGWLKHIAKNLYFDHLRRSNRNITVDEINHLESNEPSPDEQVLQQESVSRIEKLLSELQPPYQEVFHLRVVMEMSFREIGKLFDKSENWACVTYHRAKKKIQDKLED